MRRVARVLPLLGLAALAVFLASAIPPALREARERLQVARRERALDAEAALVKLRGPEYVAAVNAIRAQLPADSEYLLLVGAGGADVFVRFDLAPRRAVFGGEPTDVRDNVTLAKLPSLPEWTVVPRLDPPGPRLIETRRIAQTGSVP